MSPAFRYFRTLEIVIVGAIAVVGVVVLATPRHPIVGAMLAWGIALVVLAAFELRLRGHRRTLARVQSEVEAAAKRDLEGAGAVVQRGAREALEEVAANPRLARMLGSRSSRVCVSGTWRGSEVVIGCAVVAGRDMDLMVSFARVPAPDARGPFRLMTKGTVSSFARIGMSRHPTPSGDAVFDAKWVVDADPALCAAVLDDGLRARLMDLGGSVSGLHVASVEATPIGVVVRWPGELSGGLAATLRDLALEVRDRLTMR